MPNGYMGMYPDVYVMTYSYNPIKTGTFLQYKEKDKEGLLVQCHHWLYTDYEGGEIGAGKCDNSTFHFSLPQIVSENNILCKRIGNIKDDWRITGSHPSYPGEPKSNIEYIDHEVQPWAHPSITKKKYNIASTHATSRTYIKFFYDWYTEGCFKFKP